jgi:NAD kinase
MRKITINKYENNTHFTVHVIDSFNQEHHLGYYTHFDEEDMKELDEKCQEIWSNEVKKEYDLLGNSIKEMIEIDKNNNITSGNYDGLD